LDIFDYKSDSPEISQNFKDEVNAKSLIIGGGGLLNRSGFVLQMKLFEALSSKGKKTVLWGVGHNDKHSHTFGKTNSYNIDVNKFGLAGTRDFASPGEFVPCVSCMHEVFDRKIEEKQELGIVFHKDTLKKANILKKFEHLPSLSNVTEDLEGLIEFIGSSETVLTDSYHAMYWSMLLGKKVVVVPNSSKFYDFKYKPVFSNFEDVLKDVSKANAYSGVLEECREINIKFSEKVFDYLSL